MEAVLTVLPVALLVAWRVETSRGWGRSRRRSCRQACSRLPPQLLGKGLLGRGPVGEVQGAQAHRCAGEVVVALRAGCGTLPS